ncbi:adp-ribosylation factor-like protein 16 [Holotrichia oblita]|uniref:Adp-ribosylation factor-like protein 16 n=3 Tax=Holotrichia oblita TaxID=644536 RepID=A0ACB9TLG1_HOLOL|nr:adp-ribosylation factor-like protein 16 [Holotrichia oblita]KAI4467625.1 adp-ribosylation factor-like protein 16 [Holotrichia oblita]KAI4467646.1 adp-ribosylation factor-like protein 16 [Holotrichia oblita]
MCLCLGPTGSGKTLLLRKIQHINAVDETTTAVPTVGTNLFNLRRGNIQIEIRELGGIMAPIWPKYFASAKRIMYVVDASNLCQISAAGVLLYTVLADPQVKNVKVLLVLTKMDVSYRQMRNEALLMLQIRRLQKEVKQEIIVIEASAITGEGRNEILQWLFAEDTKRSILN